MCQAKPAPEPRLVAPAAASGSSAVSAKASATSAVSAEASATSAVSQLTIRERLCSERENALRIREQEP